MLTVRDISYIDTLNKQQRELEVMELTTQTVTHNMITPLKSISLLSKQLSLTITKSAGVKDAELIYTTS